MDQTQAKQRYEEAIKKFWDLQKVEQTEEEMTYNSKLEELERLSNFWQENLAKVEGESKELLKQLTDYDSVKEEYEFLVNRYAFLKQLLQDYDNFSS